MGPTKRRRLDYLLGHQKNTHTGEIPEDAQIVLDKVEVMWLRDLLPDLIPDARIATYSYESDWRNADLNTSIRKFGEQLLNVLHQSRSTEKVGKICLGTHVIGTKSLYRSVEDR